MTWQNTTELTRFGLVAIAGLIVDIAVAWLCWAQLGLGLTLAAGIGFLAGAAVNYLLHEFWTFQRSESRISLGRIGRYGVGLAATLAVRLCAVYVLSRVFDADSFALVILVLATGVSFIVNYVVSKFFVFRPR